MVKENELKREIGFTIVEVLIVIIILGILSSIAVISVTGAQRTALVGACKTDFAAVAAALSAFKNDTNISSGITLGDLTSGNTPYLAGLSGSEGYSIAISNSAVAVTIQGTTYQNADGCLNIT